MVNHSLNAQQQEKGNEDIDRDTVYRLEEVVVSGRQILGSKFKARNRTGSAYYISPEEVRESEVMLRGKGYKFLLPYQSE